MNNLKRLKDDRADLVTRANLLLNRIEDGSASEKDKSAYEDIMQQAEALTKRIDNYGPGAVVGNATIGVGDGFIDNTPVQRFSTVVDNITFLPGQKLHAFANNRQGREQAYSAGRFFAAALYNHGPSLVWTRDRGVNVDVMAALSGGVNSNGGALVPDELSARIIELMDTYGAFRQNADNLPMTSDTLTVPRRVGGLTAFYVGEGVAGTESDASWDNVTFTAKKLMCLTRMSSEINEDAIISLGDKLTQEISIAFATKEDQVGFNGDGTSNYGGQTGVLVKAIDGDHGKAVVQAASGHDALGDIDAADLINLMAAIPKYAKAGSKWYCCSEALALVFNAIQIAATGNNMANLANAPAPMFLGFPIVTTPVMADSPTTTYNGGVMVAFGNLAMAATVATRRDVRVAISTDVYFEQDQIGVKGTMRHSIVAHDLGSDTVKSPFAVLVGQS